MGRPGGLHLFPGTLQGHARDWFTGLPERSIKDLKEKFVAHFFQQKKHQRNHLEAHLIGQRENEPLRDFMLRFTQECQRIPRLPESQQISGFTLALHPGGLQEKLTTKVPKTFKEAIDRAYDYLRSRETSTLVREMIRKDKSWAGPSGGKRPRFDVRRDGRREDYRRDIRRDEHLDRRDKRPVQFGKSVHLVDLTKSPKKILKTERVGSTFKPPPPLRSAKKNMNKYCDFHEDHGHDTNDCRELQAEIKRALDEGKLEHLVPGAKQGRKIPAKKTFAWQKAPVKKENNDDPGPAEGHVCMVHQRRDPGKRKANVLEGWAVVPISFPPVETVSSDPVIIQARLANFQVGKIYLDNGSSSDIIYEHCFNKLPQRVRDLKRPP
uniref:uncharacterized protein LOC122588294 n=1 Tax=Erigeron canadensis TaxID=72917 RepID=UPI001CB9D02E|nr:uncharacterized protein LOC122588294 [Erigeron canadensis]